MNYVKQVDKSHYSFEKYFYRGRWMSYWYQTKEICSRSDIQTVLDVGPGTTFMHDMLKIHRPDISYRSLDIAVDLNPDFIGGITSIPTSENSFDLVSAFQVLEHIEFKDFEPALKEMKRVSRKYVFISLPHFGTSIEFAIKLPFIKRRQIAVKIPWPKKLTFQGQHYWEIGRKGYPSSRIRAIIQDHFEILDEYIPFENQYHHFFILKIR